MRVGRRWSSMCWHIRHRSSARIYHVRTMADWEKKFGLSGSRGSEVVGDAAGGPRIGRVAQDGRSMSTEPWCSNSVVRNGHLQRRLRDSVYWPELPPRRPIDHNSQRSFLYFAIRRLVVLGRQERMSRVMSMLSRCFSLRGLGHTVCGVMHIWLIEPFRHLRCRPDALPAVVTRAIVLLRLQRGCMGWRKRHVHEGERLSWCFSLMCGRSVFP